jgi:uncharacterized protein (TIGR02594 family)
LRCGLDWLFFDVNKTEQIFEEARRAEIDLDLIDTNLALSVDERWRQHDAALNRVLELEALLNVPTWVPVALAEKGVRANSGGASNPRVEEYHRSTGSASWRDSVPWCSSFLNWCMLQAGFQGTNSALARSWLSWGEPLAVPRYGCVVVLWRENPDCEKGHVGLFLRQDHEHVYLFGGNQLGEVREHAYPRHMILGYRWPTVPVRLP